MKNKIIYLISLFMCIPAAASAMHIAEGFLPPTWCMFYAVLCAPFILLGLRDIKKKTSKNKDLKMLLGLAAAYCFVLSAMKIPSVTGSCSHPTGSGLGAILFGPFVMGVLGLLVLIFQALFLAHGGITTLGANTLSMGIVGPIVSYLIYSGLKSKNRKVAVFLAAAVGDLTTYAITSIQMALAFPAKTGGFMVSFGKFIGIFAITQIPLAVIEGILTVIIVEFIHKYSSNEILMLGEEF